jgi:very-short-patch-repair endonuclease
MAGADAHRALARLAGDQHGVVARRQLFEIGFGRRAIDGMLDRGRLHGVHRGVYLVGHRAAAAGAREMAALLATGPGSALSHATAAARQGLIARPPDVVEVTVCGRAAVARPGIRVHRTDRLAADERRSHGGLLCTSPARTLLDLASRLDETRLRWAVEEGRVQRHVTAEELRDLLARHPGRRGAARLRRVVEDLTGAPSVTRSEAERRLLDVIRSAGLPAPRTNVMVGRWSVDLHWPAQRLVVEVDGFAYHGGRTAFERDRRKDADLQAAGLRVARLSWRQITHEPLVVTALLARLLTRE